MTGTREDSPSEMALRMAEAQAGARYFTDIAQALNGSLTWDTERMGTELYPVIMRALDSIEDAKEACEEAAKALEDRRDKLITELNADREGIRIRLEIPRELYGDMERCIAINTTRGEAMTAPDLIVKLLTEYANQHRDEINRFEEQHSEYTELGKQR